MKNLGFGGFRPVLTLCSSCSACPQLLVSDEAPIERQVKITDDFGSAVHMSKESLGVLLDSAKSGSLKI